LDNKKLNFHNYVVVTASGLEGAADPEVASAGDARATVSTMAVYINPSMRGEHNVYSVHLSCINQFDQLNY